MAQSLGQQQKQQQQQPMPHNYCYCSGWYHSSARILLLAEEQAAPEKQQQAEKDAAASHKYQGERPDFDAVPEWQNPLLETNDDRVFAEDFDKHEEMPIVPLPPIDDKYPPHIEELADELLHLNMLEMNELVNKLADYFGFDEAILAGGGAVANQANQEQQQQEEEKEKTKFDLRLQAFDAKSKIKVIKEVRAIAGLGLKEAKELVEGAPKIVKKDMKKEEAEELKAKLEQVGATIEIV